MEEIFKVRTPDSKPKVTTYLLTGYGVLGKKEFFSETLCLLKKMKIKYTHWIFFLPHSSPTIPLKWLSLRPVTFPFAQTNRHSLVLLFNLVVSDTLLFPVCHFLLSWLPRHPDSPKCFYLSVLCWASSFSVHPLTAGHLRVQSWLFSHMTISYVPGHFHSLPPPFFLTLISSMYDPKSLSLILLCFQDATTFNLNAYNAYAYLLVTTWQNAIQNSHQTSVPLWRLPRPTKVLTSLTYIKHL